MLFHRVNRTEAEKIFIICQNVSGSTMTAGYSVVFDTGANVDGVRVTKASATDLQAFAGVVDEDIDSNAFGRIQIYGYRSSAYIYSSKSALLTGDGLACVADWGLTPQTSSGLIKHFGFMCEAIADSTNASSQYHTTKKIFIRAL